MIHIKDWDTNCAPCPRLLTKQMRYLPAQGFIAWCLNVSVSLTLPCVSLILFYPLYSVKEQFHQISCWMEGLPAGILLCKKHDLERHCSWDVHKEKIHNNGLWFCLSMHPHEIASPAADNGPIDNSVSTPTPWVVAGPHGQLASNNIDPK